MLQRNVPTLDDICEACHKLQCSEDLVVGLLNPLLWGVQEHSAPLHQRTGVVLTTNRTGNGGYYLDPCLHAPLVNATVYQVNRGFSIHHQRQAEEDC